MTSVGLLAWALSVGPAVAAPAVEPDSLSRLALERALDAFGDAFLSADAEGLDTLLMPEYLHTNGGSGTVLDKAAWLDFVRSRRAELARGRLRVDRYETSSVTIRRHGDAAVVSSRVLSEGVRDGTPYASRLQVTQLWVRTDGRWRRAAFHDSPLPPP